MKHGKRLSSIVAEIVQSLCCAGEVLLFTLVCYHSMVYRFVRCTSRTESYIHWMQGHADDDQRQTTISSYLWWHKQVYVFGTQHMMPLVFWCCWLGDRKGIQPMKTSDSNPVGTAVNFSGRVPAQSSMWIWRVLAYPVRRGITGDWVSRTNC